MCRRSATSTVQVRASLFAETSAVVLAVQNNFWDGAVQYFHSDHAHGGGEGGGLLCSQLEEHEKRRARAYRRYNGS